MTPQDLIDDLRSRINTAYAEQVGTESWERRLCVEALEAQADEIERLRAEIDQLREINAGLRRHANGVADDNRKLLAEVEVMKRQKPVAWMCPDDPDSATAFSWKPVACELASCLKRRVPLYLAPGAQPAPSVQDEIKRLRTNAKRYEWLRAQHRPVDLPIAQVVWKRNSDPHGEWVNLADDNDLDRHIDAMLLLTDQGDK